MSQMRHNADEWTKRSQQNLTFATALGTQIKDQEERLRYFHSLGYNGAAFPNGHAPGSVPNLRSQMINHQRAPHGFQPEPGHHPHQQALPPQAASRPVSAHIPQREQDPFGGFNGGNRTLPPMPQMRHNGDEWAKRGQQAASFATASATQLKDQEDRLRYFPGGHSGYNGGPPLTNGYGTGSQPNIRGQMISHQRGGYTPEPGYPPHHTMPMVASRPVPGLIPQREQPDQFSVLYANLPNRTQPPLPQMRPNAEEWAKRSQHNNFNPATVLSTQIDEQEDRLRRLKFEEVKRHQELQMAQRAEEQILKAAKNRQVKFHTCSFER